MAFTHLCVGMEITLVNQLPAAVDDSITYKNNAARWKSSGLRGNQKFVSA
jgi:hypothetical protein